MLSRSAGGGVGLRVGSSRQTGADTGGGNGAETGAGTASLAGAGTGGADSFPSPFGALRDRPFAGLSALVAATLTGRLRVRVRRDFFLLSSESTRAEDGVVSSEEGGNMSGLREKEPAGTRIFRRADRV